MNVVEHSTPKTAIGLFVGDSLSFSDTVVSLADAEIPCLGFLRAVSLNEPLFMDADRARQMRMIIVEESILDDLITLLPQVRAKFPNANIALAFRRAEIASRLLEAVKSDPDLGQVGFLPMNLDVDSWLSLLRLLVSGAYFVPASLMPQHPHFPAAITSTECDPPEAEKPEKKVHLTDRELQVLKSAASGKQNKVIADELKVSQHTVKLHMHHIIAKLGVRNRTEAAVWFMGKRAQG